MWVTQFYNVRVYYGRGVLDSLRDLEMKEPIVVTTGSLLNSSLLREVTSRVDNPLVIRGPSQHTPKAELEVLSKIKGRNVISLGGGSIIDAVKISSPAFHVSVPTTLSGAEHTAVAGYTDDGIKKTVRTRPPDVVILDPLSLTGTPERLVVTTAFRALDHAVEASYSTKSSPFTDALSAKGYEYLVNCLVKWDLELCQVGTWLASLSFMYGGRGLSHVFGYVYGPAFNIPHGVTSCISLIEAVKFNGGAPKLGNVVETLEKILEKYRIKESLSKYTTLEGALTHAKKLSEMTNASENPRKMSVEEAKEFIETVYD
ncbi:iron-containing alcohol dehydrogenase [Metallosphaera javensis (ex Sakai et al. 2022)]|uniref:iron-containing alcohol dehydrogenase n=1 Tax=Metallosphaera javensis (ex Sakai et al. 2022) TaxID=2775498 RepID=UPI0025899714|nr:MAG: maleylacetate reductase [Metallosphaera javensis (ex Sakai et al. 2022)]